MAGMSRRRGTCTTRVAAGYHAAPDRVERQFQAQVPDHIWVADITYVQPWTGFVYLAVVHHSDKGSQYSSLALGKRCREMGVLPLTGSADDCFDNAIAESFFAMLECHLILRIELSPMLSGSASRRSRNTLRGTLPTWRG